MREFEDRYKAISARRPRSLKGESWGRALARFALENQTRGDSGAERPLLGEIRAALQARMAHYDFQKRHVGIDVETFEVINLSERGHSRS